MEYWVVFKNGMYISKIDDAGNLILTSNQNDALRFMSFNRAFVYLNLGFIVLKRISNCSEKCYICERSYANITSPLYCSGSNKKMYEPASIGMILVALERDMHPSKTEEMISYLKSLGVSDERIKLFRGK